METTACKIELPGGGEMTRTLAYERATSASLCAPVKGCRFLRFLRGATTTATSRGDGCFVRLPHLRSDQAAMALWLGGDCEELTAHTDRGMHDGREDALHKATPPFPCKGSRAARVIQFYRQRQKPSRRNKRVLTYDENWRFVLLTNRMGVEAGEVKLMKKRRDLFDKLSGVSDEELKEKDYKRYKRSYYCYIFVSSVVALLLGLLYSRLMETLAMLQRFLS